MTAPIPPIATFQHVSGPSPARWLARYTATTKWKGKTYTDFLPIIFTGETELLSIKAAADFWAEEQRAESAKAESTAARMAKARAARLYAEPAP